MAQLLTGYIVTLCAFTALGYASERQTEDLDATPRITVTYNELTEAKQFSSRVKNYSALFLEDDKGVLYVGARGAIFSLNASDISHPARKAIRWEVTPQENMACVGKGRNNQTECFNHIRLLQMFNETHLYVCGTYAFAPQCRYIDADSFLLPTHYEEGRDKCPFFPSAGYTGLIVDEVVYTATRFDFNLKPDIRKHFQHRTLKSEGPPLHWTNNAEFVASAFVRESQNLLLGDDDKIYYFFNEQGIEESLSFLDSTQVAGVARVCKNDMGGNKILQKKWTSLLKARFVCSMPYYESLKAVYTLDSGSWDTTVFYGAFVLQWRNMEASAVCRYSILDIQKVFDGPYIVYDDSALKWSINKKEVPNPRPGACITDESRSYGFNTSQDLPNNVLDFVKLHPLMYEKVKPIGDRPVLMKKNVVYTRIAVDRVTALDNKQYDVLFLGTGDGWIHKTLVIGSAVHIIEEIQVFKMPQPVENLVISKKQNSLYIGAQSGVVQIQLSGCSRYVSCSECILSRNPYCGWDGKACREIITIYDRAHMTQDVQNAIGGCLNGSDVDPPAKKLRTVLKGDDVLLPCDLRSNLAAPQWVINSTDPLDDSEGRFRVGNDGLLIMDTLLEHSGEYGCYSEENGLRSMMALYTLNVLLELPKEKLSSEPTPIVQLPTASSHTSSSIEFVYISIITILGGLCIVLSVVLLYVSCQQKRKGNYAMGLSRSTNVELQTVSSNFKEREKVDERNNYSDGCLQIIPGEAPTSSPNKRAPPPPPPPPPLPSEFTNGISTLPNMLRKMNGNSYMLLRQNEEASSPLYHSFTEELSKILEKRKHTVLVDKLDESSV
ncbi:semaphorin-4G [Pelodytes ibericus]